MNKVARTYTVEFLSAMAAYTVLILFSTFLMRQLSESVWRYPIAVLPIFPLLFALRAYIRFLNRIDELQQRIQMNAIAVASGLTLILTFTYGLLENTGLPQLSLVWVMPLFIMIWGFASGLFSNRFQ